MNSAKKHKHETQVTKTGFLSRLFFFWVTPLTFIRFREKEQVELFETPEEDESGFLGSQLEKAWNDEKSETGKPHLLRCILWVHKRSLILLLGLTTLNECVISIFPPILLQQLILALSDSESRDRYVVASLLCLSLLVYPIVLHQSWYVITLIGMKIRIALCVLIYKKSLRLDLSKSRPAVINLLAADTTRFDLLFAFLYVIPGPIQIVIFSYLLWIRIGVAVFPIIAIVITLVFAQYFITKEVSNIRQKCSKETDKRVGFLSEVINAVRVIKMYACEQPISDVLYKIRKSESRLLLRRGYFQAFYNISLNLTLSIVVFIVALLLYEDGRLKADVIFFFIAALTTVVRSNAKVLRAAGIFAGIHVAISRIQAFLCESEAPKRRLNEEAGVDDIIRVKLDGVNAGWKADETCLKDICMELAGPQLVIVTGQIGSGKSSLLNVLTSEIPHCTGDIDISGKVSFCSQQPWLFGGSIRENVIFDQLDDKLRYNEVIDVCGLTNDLAGMSAGDESAVGERGCNLSGGQKARVNLARCVFQHGDIYLLDDPLAAVDTTLASHIFNQLKNYLKQSIVVIVTHQQQFLPLADWILVVENGGIVSQGTFDQVKGQIVEAKGETPGNDTETQEEEDIDKNGKKSKEEKGRSNYSIENKEFVSRPSTAEVYSEYFGANGSKVVTVLIGISLVLSQLSANALTYWVAVWSRNSTDIFYLWVFVGLFAVVFVFGVGSTFAYFVNVVRIGINLHSQMFHSVIRAPCEFFDANPSGRILNRFSQDFGIADDLLPDTILHSIQVILMLLGTVIVVAVVKPLLLIPSTVIVAYFWLTRQAFIRPAKIVRRLQAQSKSPSLTHLAETLAGLATIRNAKAEAGQTTKFQLFQNLNTAASFTLLALQGWCGLWIDLGATVYAIAVILIFLAVAHFSTDSDIEDSSATGASIGVALTTVLGLCYRFQHGIRTSCDTENHMISVERLVEYCRLPNEEQHEEKVHLEDWRPSKGQISFSNVSLSYQNDMALCDVSFEIRSGEKIGLVGRTGAGKSSILVALFRMREISKNGSIVIDGMKTDQLTLAQLRKSISIMPQDPIIFPQTTIRSNLDPFNHFEDVDIWAVLEELQLKSVISSLDLIVTSQNQFSLGYRQLLCLARLILHKSRIVVLDEPTANIDPTTESAIWNVIDKNFTDCTLIVVTHRKSNLAHLNRILHLDNGQLVRDETLEPIQEDSSDGTHCHESEEARDDNTTSLHSESS